MSEKTQRCRNELDYAREVAPIASLWKHYLGGTYVVLGYVICTDSNPTQARVRHMRVDGPDFDPVAEQGIEYARLVNEWTIERFERMM